MTRRLSDKYKIRDQVEVMFVDRGWLPAHVVRHDHPGLWVVDEKGKLWFVTNTTRIRPKDDES